MSIANEISRINNAKQNIKSSMQNLGITVGNETIDEYPEKLKNKFLGCVDLGLPSGNLWAACNIGANSPEETGLYFSWGNVEGHTADSGYAFNKFSYEETPGYTLASSGGNIPPVSGKDAATTLYGGTWRIPSVNDFMELVYNCTYTTVEVNGVSGMQFTSKTNDYQLFLPYTGVFVNTQNNTLGTKGNYITVDNAEGFTFNSFVVNDNDEFNVKKMRRQLGYTIRSVR